MAARAGEGEGGASLGEGGGEGVGDCVELPLTEAQGVGESDPLPLGGSEGLPVAQGEGEGVSPAEGDAPLLGEAAPHSDAEGAADAVVDAEALPEALVAGEREAEAGAGDGLGEPLLEGPSTDCADVAEGVPPAPPLALPAADSEDRGDALRGEAE